jgi:hypothetical protein
MGPPTSELLGAPDQGAVKGHVEPLGSYMVEINLTDQTLLLLTLVVLTHFLPSKYSNVLPGVTSSKPGCDTNCKIPTT